MKTKLIVSVNQYHTPQGCEWQDLGSRLQLLTQQQSHTLNQVSVHENPRDGGSLVGCCPWGHIESNTTEAT